MLSLCFVTTAESKATVLAQNRNALVPASGREEHDSQLRFGKILKGATVRP